MEVRIRLRHRDDRTEGYETHVVETGGETFIMIKFPIPEEMSHPDVTDFMQKQAIMLREFLGREFILMPVRSGQECEMGVLDPDVDDLKECIRALPEDQRKKLMEELAG